MEDEIPQARLELAPWVRNTLGLIGWLWSWAVFAVATGIVWDFALHGSLAMDRVVARLGLVALMLVMFVFIVFLLDAAEGEAQRMWDRYPWAAAKRVILVLTVLFSILSVPYLWLMVWVARKVEPKLMAVSAAVPWGAGELRWHTSSPMWVGLFLIDCTLLVLIGFIYRSRPFYSFHKALAVLGVGKFLGGVLLMAHLRFMVPRRDFWLQAPIVAWMWMSAVGVLLYCAIPYQIFAISTPLLLLILVFPFLSSLYAPPLWIFFGGSKSHSFALFYALRMQWQRHGLNLLNRKSRGGIAFYDAWRSQFRYAGPPNPNIGRVWSLRTRGPLWQSAVRLVAAFVPVIVIDLTKAASNNVEFEVEWLKRRGFLHKVWVVVASQSDEVADIYRKLGVRVVEKEALLASEWSGSSLNL